MNTNNANTSEQRQCHRCKQALPLTKQFFMSDKSRPFGLSYECKSCHSARKKGRVRRDGYSRMTRAQKDRKLAWQRNYGKTNKGRSIFLLKAYQAIDKKKGQVCDLDQAFIVSMFSKPCVYCGTTEQIGCDRVDNSQGHTIANVVPACADCNIMRGDRFSHEEMIVLGRAIRQVRAARGKRID